MNTLTKIKPELDGILHGAVMKRLAETRDRYVKAVSEVRAEEAHVLGITPRTPAVEARRQELLAKAYFLGPMGALLKAICDEPCWAEFAVEADVLATELYPHFCRAETTSTEGFQLLWERAFALVGRIVIRGAA